MNYLKYISLLLCFCLLVTGIVLFSTDIDLVNNLEKNIPYQFSFSLYPGFNQLLELAGYNPTTETKKELETKLMNSKKIKQRLQKKGRKILSDVGYKQGVAYLNLTPNIYKLNTFEQLEIIELLINEASSVSGIKYIQFLINSQKLSLSPFLDVTQQIKAREKAAKIAIIIDDFGNRAQGTKKIFALKQKITCAIMPFEKQSTTEARKAIKQDFDVIIHLPMEAELDRPNWLGPKPILTELSDQEIKTRMKEAINDIPQAIGFNNHTGDKATADRHVMEMILKVAKQKGLIAIDSRTTPDTVVKKVAHKLNVPVLERDVFLDHQKNYGYIRKALLKLAGKAIKQGQAIGIGHVGPHGGNVTVLALHNILPKLDQTGIRFVGVKDLINQVN
ncbi:hypothetical protein JCM15060_00660 [Halanaerobaculum tunisiense]